MKKIKKNNYLDYIPVRNFEWIINEENHNVIIKRPKFDNRFLKKYITPRLKKAFFEIKLDKIGSFVWNKCDGTMNIYQISEALKTEFGDEVDPVYERVSQFIKSLNREKIVSLK